MSNNSNGTFESRRGARYELYPAMLMWMLRFIQPAAHAGYADAMVSNCVHHEIRWRALGYQRERTGGAPWASARYILRRYARSARRSSGRILRSNFTPSVDATGGTTPAGAVASTNLKNSI